jgi:cell division protein FtsL
MTRLNIVLIVTLLLSAFALINARHRTNTLFYKLEQAQQSAKQMNIEFARLEVEQSNLSSPGRVNQLALRDLRMQKITPPKTVYIDLRDKTVVKANLSMVQVRP